MKRHILLSILLQLRGLFAFPFSKHERLTHGCFFIHDKVVGYNQHAFLSQPIYKKRTKGSFLRSSHTLS